MRTLKGLVIAMAVFIVIGVAVLVYGLYQTAGKADSTFFSSAVAVKGFGDITVPLPAGCAIAGMRPDGDRLFLRIGPDGPCSRIIAVDLASGKLLGTVTVGR